MEWLLVFYFNMGHGSISTERVKTYEECMTIGNTMKKDTAILTVSSFKCMEIKKL